MLLPLHQALGPLGYRHGAPAGPHPRWANLVAGWKLDEPSDGSVSVPRADVLGVYGLTDNNTVASVAGVTGSAANIVGASNESLTINTTAFRMAGDLTLALWVQSKGTPGGDAMVGGYRDAAVTDDFQIFQGAFTNNFFARVRDSVEAEVKQTFRTVTQDAWHLLIAVYTASDRVVRLSSDGDAFTASTALTTGLRQLGTTWRIGHPGAGQAIYVDDTYLFSEAKDAAWITDMYNGGAGRAYPN